MAFPNVAEALGIGASSIIRAAAEKHVSRLVGSSESLSTEQWEETVAAMEWTLDYWMDVVLGFINTQGLSDTYGSQDLRLWNSSVQRWISDEELATELLRTMLYPEQPHLPRVDVLEASRQRAQPLTPPYEYPWPLYVMSFRQCMQSRGLLNDELRCSLNKRVPL